MIKAILFDIDNTLLDFDKCAESSILLTCKKFGLPFTDSLLSTFKEVTAIVWRKIEDGLMTREELRCTRWQIIFDKLKITGVDPVGFEDDFRIRLISASDEVDGALDTLKYLYGKYNLYCASNAPAGQQESRLKDAKMFDYFKEIFVSGNIGLYKPNKDFFDYCFSHFPNLKKDEVLMVGDDIHADIGGAMSYGIKTCFFNKHKKEVTDIKPDITITSISDLKNIL